jgi:hypothetical protein
MTRYRRLLLLVFPFALLGVRCNTPECEAKRDELWALKDAWTRCEHDLDCVKILGNSGDCSGVLTCDFAANRSSRLEAERRLASLPEETTDCTHCISPNCVSGVITLCEPVSQRCMLVTEVRDGGTISEGKGGTTSEGSGGTTGEGSGGTAAGETGSGGTDAGGNGSGGTLLLPSGGTAGSSAAAGSGG